MYIILLLNKEVMKVILLIIDVMINVLIGILWLFNLLRNFGVFFWWVKF